MGLRGCVDAWGAPVKKPELGGLSERFKPEPSLTAPESNKAESNKLSLTRKTPDVAKPSKPKPATRISQPAAARGAPPAAASFDRAAYQREYMRAKRAKAKESRST